MDNIETAVFGMEYVGLPLARLMPNKRRLNDEMGDYVANQVVKAMDLKGIVVKDSKILILGIALKENSSEIGNTKVVDIVKTLSTYTANIDIFDMRVDKKAVKREYGLDVVSEGIESYKGKFDAVILAVSHREFADMDVRSFLKDNGIVYDVKGVLPKDKIDAKLQLHMKICLIEEIGMHYREAIYKKMGEELGCDFYFSDRKVSVKHFDYEKFPYLKGIYRKFTAGVFSFSPAMLKSPFKYDVIIVDGTPYDIGQWFLAIINLIFRRKLCAWTHGWYGRENLAKRILKKIFFSMFSIVFTYGNNARNMMIKNGFSPSKIKTIYNSLDFDAQSKFINMPKSDIYKKHFGNDKPVFIYIGRIQPRKRLDMVVSLVKRLKGTENEINFVVVGKIEGFGESIRKLANDENVSQNFWFFGGSYDERTNAELLMNADACITPCSIGLTAIHSATYGCPVITHDNPKHHAPEFESVIDGKTGILFAENDENSLEEAVKKIISLTPKEKADFSENSRREIAAHWNPSVQIDILKKELGIK